MVDASERARAIAAEFFGRGEPIAWFEALYSSVGDDASSIPWAALKPHPGLTDWMQDQGLRGADKRALVIACGLGDDAEALAGIGFDTVAFDVSSTAISWCRKRFPDTNVTYTTADLLEPPESWNQAFDFVFEVYTIQSLPLEMRARVLSNTARFVAHGGSLLLICAACEPGEDRPHIPWPLTKPELDGLCDRYLVEEAFEEYRAPDRPGLRQFRVHYTHP